MNKKSMHRMLLVARLASAFMGCSIAGFAWSQVGDSYVDPKCQLLPLSEGAGGSLTSTAFFSVTQIDPNYPMEYTKNLCYGDLVVQWDERKYGDIKRETLYRTFEYYRPVNTQGKNIPVIIWAHPSGPNYHHMSVKPDENKGGGIETKVVPAILRGFAFISIQSRHPTASQLYQAPGTPPPWPPLTLQDGQGGPVAVDAKPSTDIADAVQWVKQNAAGLMIDTNNVFLMGQSRGSVALLTTLMPDQKINTATDYHKQSSKPRAFFAAQAQVTYAHEQVKSLFLKQYASPEALPSLYDQHVQYQTCWIPLLHQFDYFCHFDKADVPINNPTGQLLSAYDQLDLTDPPVWIRYDRSPTQPSMVVKISPYVLPAGVDQAASNIDTSTCFETFESGGCIDVHHPHFGLALYNRYLAVLSPQPVPAIPAVFVQYTLSAITGPPTTKARRDYAGSHFFDNYWCFFIQHMTLAGNTVRKTAVPPSNVGGDASDCALSTTDVWPPTPLPQ